MPVYSATRVDALHCSMMFPHVDALRRTQGNRAKQSVAVLCAVSSGVLSHVRRPISLTSHKSNSK